MKFVPPESEWVDVLNVLPDKAMNTFRAHEWRNKFSFSFIQQRIMHACTHARMPALIAIFPLAAHAASTTVLQNMIIPPLIRSENEHGQRLLYFKMQFFKAFSI